MSRQTVQSVAASLAVVASAMFSANAFAGHGGGGGGGGGGGNHSGSSNSHQSSARQLNGLNLNSNKFQQSNNTVRTLKLGGSNGSSLGFNKGKNITPVINLHNNPTNNTNKPPISTIISHPVLTSGGGNAKSTFLDKHFNDISHTLSHPIIDPGKGNGNGSGNGSGNSHDHDHSHHGHCNNWPWLIGYGFPATYRYPSYPCTHPVLVGVPVAVPVSVPVATSKLVNGIDLQLVDLRMVDEGDAARKLGPRYRVVVGNQGTQAAGNFQVMLIASEDQNLNPEKPSTMIDVAGVPSGDVVTVDIRLPTGAMTMLAGKPFNLLGVIIDPNKMVDEVTKDNNAGMLERTKVQGVEQPAQ